MAKLWRLHLNLLVLVALFLTLIAWLLRLNELGVGLLIISGLLHFFITTVVFVHYRFQQFAALLSLHSLSLLGSLGLSHGYQFYFFIIYHL